MLSSHHLSELTTVTTQMWLILPRGLQGREQGLQVNIPNPGELISAIFSTQVQQAGRLLTAGSYTSPLASDVTEILPRNCALAWCGFRVCTCCMCCVTMVTHCWGGCFLNRGVAMYSDNSCLQGRGTEKECEINRRLLRSGMSDWGNRSVLLMNQCEGVRQTATPVRAGNLMRALQRRNEKRCDTKTLYYELFYNKTAKTY